MPKPIAKILVKGKAAVGMAPSGPGGYSLPSVKMAMYRVSSLVDAGSAARTICVSVAVRAPASGVLPSGASADAAAVNPAALYGAAPDLMSP